MKNDILIGILLGFGAGFGAGYIFCNTINKKKINKQIAEVMAASKRKEETSEQIVDPAKELKEDGSFKEISDNFKKSYDQDKKRYEEEAKLYSPSEVEVKQEVKQEHHYIFISDTEFKNSTNDSYCLYRYDDGIICDDELNEVMSDFADEINHEFDGKELDILYVRDNICNKDYEIDRTIGSYKDISVK